MTKTKTRAGTAGRKKHAAGDTNDSDRLVGELARRGAPMTIDELRDVLGGDREDVREAAAEAIGAGRVRLAKSTGGLFSAIRFEIVPSSKTLDREIRQAIQSPPRSRGVTATDLPGDVMRAALQISGGRGRRVMLTDLRRALPGARRTELDDALVAMSRKGQIALFPNDDRHSVTAEDRRDAVNLSGVPQHILYLP